MRDYYIYAFAPIALLCSLALLVCLVARRQDARSFSWLGAALFVQLLISMIRVVCSEHCYRNEFYYFFLGSAYLQLVLYACSKEAPGHGDLVWLLCITAVFGMSKFFGLDESYGTLFMGGVLLLQSRSVLSSAIRWAREKLTAGSGVLVLGLLLNIFNVIFISADFFGFHNLHGGAAAGSFNFLPVSNYLSVLFVVLGVVVSVLERREADAVRVASIDPLTGVWNRRRILDAAIFEVSRLNRYGESLSMVLIDVDHFKAVNDGYGHVVGDSVLKELCARVRLCIRDVDIFGRWGGEEFVIILPSCAIESAAALAERIRIAVEEKPLCGVNVTASFGVSECAQFESFESWFDRADKAVYAAKNNGRNRVEHPGVSGRLLSRAA